MGVTQVGERIWLVTFMQYDLGYFEGETCRLEPIENPFGRKCYLCPRNKLLPMCPERTSLAMATLEGFEPSISTLKGWRAGPLHHRVMRLSHYAGAPTGSTRCFLRPM